MDDEYVVVDLSFSKTFQEECGYLPRLEDDMPSEKKVPADDAQETVVMRNRYAA